MAIKLNNLTKWRELPGDKSLLLRGDGGGGLRKIVVNLNTEAPTSFVALEHGVEYFLGVVDGLDAIHFSAFGEVEVSATGDGMVWYWTDDGDDHSYEHDEDHKLFIVPMTREQRSPAMDALAAKIQERADRRFEAQARNNQALRAQLARERAENAASQEPVDDTAGTGEHDAVASGDAPNPAPVGAG